MKLISIILFLSSLSLVFSAQVVCPRYQCNSRGASCGYVDGQTEIMNTNCKSYDDQCLLTQKGNDFTKGVCTAKATLNQPCGYLVDDEIDNYVSCAKGLSCVLGTVGTTRTCVANPITTTARGGEYCDATTTCAAGTCNNHVCSFAADGQTCQVDSDCNYRTSSCITASMSTSGICTPDYIPAGGACVVNGTSAERNCVAGSSDAPFALGSCVPNGVNQFNGVCQLSFSQKKGHACTRTDQCEKGYCTTPKIGDLYGECAKTRKTSSKDKFCVDQSDCTSDNGEVCVCEGDDISEVKCKVMDFSASDFSRYFNLKDCALAQAANCGDYALQKNADCIINACKKDFCNSYKETKAFGVVPFGYPRCSAVEVCAGSAVYASLPLMIIVALAAMFFC